MKNKLVVWGTNAESEKVLLALELQPETNKVMLYTFPESIATDEFVTLMMDKWRDGETVEFPEGYATLERELTVADQLLPEGLTPEREDIIQRAQTEWHFVILSGKLHRAYQEELAEFKDRVASLGAFDQSTWDSLKEFWDKVQEQARDRNLFREHADSLRDDINALFDDLKKMRSDMQAEFVQASRDLYEQFTKRLETVEEKINSGGSKLNSIFDELKQIQRNYRDAKMTNEHRNKLWSRLDGAFKAAKEKKFGPDANEGSLSERHNKRLKGLQDAIRRMEDSVRRDEDELKFQQKKIATTEGQLEAQIRQAKIKMIEERLASKREKLEEMYQTRANVEKQVAQAKEKEERRKQMEEAKKAAKEEIAAEVKTSTAPDAPEANEDDDDNKEQPDDKQGDNLLEAVGNILEESLEDVGDSVKAIASVLGDKAEKALDKAMAKAEEFVEKRQEEREKRKKTKPDASEPVEIPVEDAPEAETAATEETGTETAPEEPAATPPDINAESAPENENKDGDA